MMKWNNFTYLFKEGIRGIFKHGFMSFAAVCVTVACLLVVGVFSCLIYNLNLMVEDLNKTNEVVAYVDEALSDAEAKSISTKFISIDNIYSATFKTRDEALKEFVADHPDDEAFSGVDATYLRHRYEIILKDNAQLEATVEQLESIDGIAKVSAAYELAEGFSTLQNVLHIVSIAVIVVLLVVSLLIISNTVKLAMYDRKDEIAIMKMVGATNGFIRTPFVVEGFALGMLGAALAFGLLWLLYDLMVARLAVVDTLKLLSFVPFNQLVWPMIIVFGLAGMFVGVVGSWFSIRKFLDV